MSKPYWQKLQDPRWQRKRLEVLNRAEFKCESCGDGTSTLQVHHGYYDRKLEPWEYAMETLWCLCANCHKKAQEALTQAQRELAKFKPQGSCDLISYGLRALRERSECEVQIGDLHNIAKHSLGLDHDHFVKWLEVTMQHNAEDLKSAVFKLYTKAVTEEPRWVKKGDES